MPYMSSMRFNDVAPLSQNHYQDVGLLMLCECETYESISSGFSSLSVGDHNCFINVSVDLEVFPEGFVCGMVGQAPHKQLGQSGVLLSSLRLLLLLLHSCYHSC